jgi:hypothetical protein
MLEAKYPSTPHLPWSGTVGGDDSVLDDYKHFRGKCVVVTEKMDGENTSMYGHKVHARSLSSTNHPSRDWVKAFWANSGISYYLMHDYLCLVGENLYAKHSIKYTNLKSYFYGFAIRTMWQFYGWDETVEIFNKFEIQPVPVLYRGVWDYHKIKGLVKELDLSKQEGYVVRLEGRFAVTRFEESVAKYVRPNHVASSAHWLYGGTWEKNGLAK